MHRCPTCGSLMSQAPTPPEPPVGTWVKDRRGAVSTRFILDGHDGWAPPSCMPLARWAAMWEARGPLVVCGPYGGEL